MSSNDRFDDHTDDDHEDSHGDDSKDHSTNNPVDDSVTSSRSGSRGRSRGRGGSQGRGRGRDNLASNSSVSGSTSDSIDDSTDDSSRAMGKSSSAKGRGSDDKRSSKGAESFNVVNATEIPPGGTGVFESLATAQRDKLTGLFNGVKVKTTYTWLNLGDSLLKVRGRAGYDIVENFTVNNPEGSDDLFAPQTITTTSIATSNGNISKLAAGQINARVLSANKFVANSAAAFTCTGFEGLFVAFNDGRDGYQPNSDTLLFIQGYNLASGPLTVN